MVVIYSLPTRAPSPIQSNPIQSNAMALCCIDRSHLQISRSVILQPRAPPRLPSYESTQKVLQDSTHLAPQANQAKLEHQWKLPLVKPKRLPHRPTMVKGKHQSVLLAPTSCTPRGPHPSVHSSLPNKPLKRGAWPLGCSWCSSVTTVWKSKEV